jgi:hypothetical protein
MFHPFRRLLAPLAGVMAFVTLPNYAAAQLPDSPFRNVDPIALSLDSLNKGGVWTLNFAYVAPRIITVDVPNQGKKTVWYMPYYVYNKTGQPRTIFPEFELVTKDPDGVLMSSLDEPHPGIVDEIKKIEDQFEKLDYLTTISISKRKIPVAKPDTYPQSQAVHGIAVWLDVPAKSNPNNFSIYVTGLSDGLAKKEVEDKAKGETKVLVSKKTLKIDLRRPVATSDNRTDDIQVNDNNGLGAEQWIYREASISTKKVPPTEEKK